MLDLEWVKANTNVTHNQFEHLALATINPKLFTDASMIVYHKIVTKIENLKESADAKETT